MAEVSSEAEGSVAAAKSPKPASLLSSAKRILRPAWELITETPDQHIGWSRSATKLALALCEEGGFEAIYTTGPPHSTHLVGQKVNAKLGLPWIADFRDPWARRPWVKSRNPWGQRMLSYFEKRVAAAASCVILNNETSAVDFRHAYPNLPESKFVAIPNGFDPDFLKLLTNDEPFLTENSAKDNLPVLCHPGTLYGQRDPKTILEAIAILRRQGLQVRFQQVGFVSPKLNPLSIARELGIEDLVECHPAVPQAEVLAYMGRASALLILQPNGGLMVPGKLYEMLLFDKPIIAICDSEATSAVTASAGSAWNASSHDVEGIAEAIRNALFSGIEIDVQQRAIARQKYNGRQLVGELSKIITDCVNRKKATMN